MRRVMEDHVLVSREDWTAARLEVSQQGYRVPSGGAEAFVLRVRALALPGPLLSLIAPLFAVMRHLNCQLA